MRRSRAAIAAMATLGRMLRTDRLEGVLAKVARLTIAAFAGVGAASAFAASQAPSTSHPLTIQVIMSQKAHAKLQAMGEAVKVSAFFDGAPIPSKKKLADEIGRLGIAPAESTLLPASGGTATIKAIVSNEKWEWVTERSFLINVTSARKVDRENNLLKCPAVDGDLANPPKAPIVIACKLIRGE